jgi:hypothetical protein
MKQWLKLISVGNATTRITSISANLIREIVPDATRETKLLGHWSVVDKKLVLEVRKDETS